MAIDKEMEGYARDCVRLAGLTDDPAIHEPLMQMAREWMQAALGELKANIGRAVSVPSFVLGLIRFQIRQDPGL